MYLSATCLFRIFHCVLGVRSLAAPVSKAFVILSDNDAVRISRFWWTMGFTAAATVRPISKLTAANQLRISVTNRRG